MMWNSCQKALSMTMMIGILQNKVYNVDINNYEYVADDATIT